MVAEKSGDIIDLDNAGDIGFVSYGDVTATDFVTKETARLKDHLKEELKKIDEVLKKKLDSLSKVEADSKLKAEELAQKQANLKWLEDIQDRVTNIINF